MTEAIKERNKLTLAMLELAPDKVFMSLIPEARMKLVEEALSVGEEIANSIISECGTDDPRKIAEMYGVKVVGEERGNLKKTEYRKKEKEIVIFRDSLDRMAAEITVPHLSERILRFLIAHELFHHLEETKLGYIYKRFKFKGFLWSSKYIKGLSDVAAQAFTQKLLSLEFSPHVFDYLTYILYTSDFKH